MSGLSVSVLSGIEAFEAISCEWNDLWARSHARQPTTLAGPIKNWVQTFSPTHTLTTVCVRSSGQLLAGIPLIRAYARGVLPYYRLPTNCWANSGDLLVDAESDVDSVLRKLLTGIEDSCCGLLSFEEIALDSPQWMALRRLVEERSGEVFVSQHSPVAVIDILHEWDRYEKSWSSNHRGAVKRSYRKLAKQGSLRAELFTDPDEHELRELLTDAFRIENRGWKGEAETSVLKTPGMQEFMIQEAQAIMDAKCLHLWFLFFNDKPIAFEYCHFAKGVCYSHKIGYEPEFSKAGPGRLLRYLQLRHYHADSNCHTFDMLGTVCDSKSKWATRSYTTGRMRIAVGRSWPRIMLRGLAWAHPRWQAIRSEPAAEFPTLGAAGMLDQAADQQTAT